MIDARKSRRAIAIAMVGAIFWSTTSALSSAGVGELREWTDMKGRSFEGRALGVDENGLLIKRERDERVFTVSIKQLSERDRAYFEEVLVGKFRIPDPVRLAQQDPGRPIQDRNFSVTEDLRPAVSPALDPLLGPDGRRLPALRWYPSAHLPPVSDPYIFHYWSSALPLDREDSAYNSKRTQQTELAQRGILPLRWHWGPQNPHVDQAKDQWEAYLKRVRPLLPPQHPYYLDRSPSLGIAVDEWQKTNSEAKKGHPLHPENPFGLIGSIQGMIDAKALNPELFIGVYWRGEATILPVLQHGTVDMLIIEGIFPNRGERARQAGYIDRTIFMHGYRDGSDDLETVEKRIRAMRERFPEMPGMALYTGGGTEASYRDDDAQWLAAFDDLLYRYFIEPAPEVRFVAPHLEAWISDKRVTLQAEARSKDDRAIRKYRWFVDNRLVAETEEPAFEWDTTREWPGRHMLTVHAIDEEWNRAAAQIPIRLVHRGGEPEKAPNGRSWVSPKGRQ